jgi:predicted DNA-binding protein (MmcQ/YjbR family)
MNSETLRSFCLQLPGAREEIKWDDDLCFKVAGKLFAILWLGHTFKLSLKISDQERASLLEMEHVIPAPYLARAGWLSFHSEHLFPEAKWQSLLLNSYQLVVQKLPKNQQKELGLKSSN